MKYLMTAVALGLAIAGGVDAAGTVSSRTSSNVSSSVNSSSTVNSSSSVTSSTSNGSTVSSSSDVGGTNSVVTNQVVGNRGSLCTAEIDGKRCEVKCRLPRVAQCGKAADASGPSCLCQ